MTTPANRPLSTRQQLARIALSAALAVDGVVAGTPGPHGLHVTPAGPERLPGVFVAATAGGRFSVDLHLVCRPVALHPLADQVRASVHAAATAAGLQGRLGPVGVHIDDVQPGALP